MVGVISQKYNLTPGVYLTTRTREDFSVDIESWITSFIAPVTFVASQFLGSKGDDTNDSETAEHITAAPSSQPYSWYRASPGQNYAIHNLDTKDPTEANRITSMLRGAFSASGPGAVSSSPVT